MPIGVSNFQILTPQQTNPFMSGMSNSFSTLGKALLDVNQAQQNRKQSLLMKYAEPEAQANLQKTQLGNQLSQATLPYAGPTAAANLQQTQLNNKWMDPKMTALIAYQQAQTGKANQETIKDKITN